MSSTVVVRRIAATPARPAAAAWTVVVGLVSPVDSAARQELDRVAGIGASMIAAEAMRDSPIVVIGSGPRLRMYCLFGEAAILGEEASESALPWCPTGGDWVMSLPCPLEDLPWVRAALASLSSRVTARDAAEAVAGELEAAPRMEDDGLGQVDEEAFLRP